MTKEQYQAVYDRAERDPGRVSREVAEQQIADGALRGYLVYADGKSIGWCNANDRANYPFEPVYDVPFYAPAEKKEKAVICFEIAPEYRGKGIATALLSQVITDAKAVGYAAVVGFPVVRSERYEWDCRGPVRLYEKLGFVKTAEADQNENVIMKIKLK
jgi:GNAT superfamily N-acetyltransferase